MSDRDNPYGGSGTGMTANVSFGAGRENVAPSGAADLLGAPAAGEVIKETSTAAFSADVIQESRRQPVLVDFWAPWCGPCKQLAPALEKVVRESGGQVKLVKLNIDEHPAIPGQLGIQSIPAVIAFKDGQPVDGFMGAVPESQIREFVKKISAGGGNKIDEALAAASEAREGGDPQTAAQIYSAVLQQEPEHVEALAGLADLLFEAGQADEARAVLERVPEAKKDAAAVAAVRAKMALAEQVAELGDPAELQRRLEADPSDHEARFDLALVRNAQGQREEAVENLLAIVKADRGWKDDAARTKLLELFDAWGASDPVTLSARRRLSSLLFS
ncbi:thioredoxin [Chelativorans sp. M5D2P16]|uniref:thioredoxin n=1 Tax=Chelativorans sp. M5D2P16 TaxID=3095678 RepID=UPI002ACAD930|nr:thioredoxin [Chelativorans sp. M5D2P16]MDZ5696759.1 thioredoxin [Chelativorans sp. M5D2P16]